MRSILLSCSICFLAASIFTDALVHRNTAAQAKGYVSHVGILPDDKNSLLRLQIDDRDIAVIGKDGLRVNGSITYTGQLAKSAAANGQPGSEE